MLRVWAEVGHGMVAKCVFFLKESSHCFWTQVYLCGLGVLLSLLRQVSSNYQAVPSGDLDKVQGAV